jgi:hypothetical protein
MSYFKCSIELVKDLIIYTNNLVENKERDKTSQLKIDCNKYTIKCLTGKDYEICKKELL